MMAFDQPGHVLGGGADPAQQIPADHAQAVGIVVWGKSGSHLWNAVLLLSCKLCM